MLVKVEIEEILQKQITLEASDYKDAIKKVKKLYNNSDIILDSDNFIEVSFKVLDEFNNIIF